MTQGKDPQPDDMKGYQVMVEDNGGVHIYSGIPNRAFYLASVALGGYSWEKAGKIWWETMRSGKIAPKCQFKHFADITVETAKELFGKEAAKIVRKAWTDVGVTRGQGQEPRELRAEELPPPEEVVQVQDRPFPVQSSFTPFPLDSPEEMATSHANPAPAMTSTTGLKILSLGTLCEDIVSIKSYR